MSTLVIFGLQSLHSSGVSSPDSKILHCTHGMYSEHLSGQACKGRNTLWILTNALLVSYAKALYHHITFMYYRFCDTNILTLNCSSPFFSASICKVFLPHVSDYLPDKIHTQEMKAWRKNFSGLEFTLEEHCKETEEL